MMTPQPPPNDVELREERERRLRRFSSWAQAGGLVFLAVVTLGLIPGVIEDAVPAAGPTAAVVIWVLAPAVPITLLVVAAFRFRR